MMIVNVDPNSHMTGSLQYKMPTDIVIQIIIIKIIKRDIYKYIKYIFLF